MSFYFHPYFGEMIQFESEHIFQTGLVQPEKDKHNDTCWWFRNPKQPTTVWDGPKNAW